MQYANIAVIIVLGVWMISACDSMTSSYEKHSKEGEIIYTGKADSIQVYPGKNRVKLSWLLLMDPMVTKARVYWNQREDSVDVKIQRGEGVDTVTVMIEEMEERSYNFEIVTSDDQGNTSVPVTALGDVYGARYQSSLLNRPVKTVKWQPDGTAWIEWGSASQSAIGTLINYVNSDNTSEKIVVLPDEGSTKLKKFSLESVIEYRTMHLPDSMAIDTFYTAAETADINEIYLKNSGFPFKYAEWDGNRWGYPENWIINDAVKNQGDYGGFDGIGGGGYLSMEKWNDSQAEIINGKIYQTMTLPAGIYSFEANFSDESAGFDIENEAYMVVAEDSSLPDIADVKHKTLGYTTFDNPNIEFTLTQRKEIAIGFVATFQQNQQNFRCHSVRLYKLE